MWKIYAIFLLLGYEVKRKLYNEINSILFYYSIHSILSQAQFLYNGCVILGRQDIYKILITNAVLREKILNLSSNFLKYDPAYKALVESCGVSFHPETILLKTQRLQGGYSDLEIPFWNVIFIWGHSGSIFSRRGFAKKQAKRMKGWGITHTNVFSKAQIINENVYPSLNH